MPGVQSPHSSEINTICGSRIINVLEKEIQSNDTIHNAMLRNNYD